MKPLKTRFFLPLSFLSMIPLFAVLFLATASIGHAQTPQLSLADLLIGLRSQKVTLPERNRILTEAVKERGITFVYSAEIAKELEATGAGPELLAAIREKGTPKPVATPTPAPPDHTFYQRRANENAVKGDYKLALADYNKAAEMKSDDYTILLGRGRTHFNLRSYDLSVADYNRALEIAPNESSAYYNRGVSYERMGELANAMADYKRAVELDEKNEAAKTNLKRLEDEIAKIEALRVEAEEKAKADAAAVAAAKKAAEEKAVPPPAPEYLHVGTLTAANADRMSMPQYPQIAARSRIEGRVTVDVELNEKGDVVKADAVSGPQMLRGPAEDAARRSKFKPYDYNGTPVKAKGTIIYNFNLKPGEEE